MLAELCSPVCGWKTPMGADERNGFLHGVVDVAATGQCHCHTVTSFPHATASRAAIDDCADCTKLQVPWLLWAALDGLSWQIGDQSICRTNRSWSLELEPIFPACALFCRFVSERSTVVACGHCCLLVPTRPSPASVAGCCSSTSANLREKEKSE